jgi:tetratricopeptide (TPR) repeat protein
MLQSCILTNNKHILNELEIMSSSALRKKLSFRRNGKKKRGSAAAAPLLHESASSTESTASCSPPPPALGSFPVSPPQEISPPKNADEKGSQWSLAQHLKEQQEKNQKRKQNSDASLDFDNNNNNKSDLQQHSPRELWKQATALDSIGNALLEKGHYTRARMTYERALILKQTSLSFCETKNADLLASVATSINNIGYLRQRAGASPQDSMAAYQDSLALKRDILGMHSLSVGKTLNNIGSVHYSQQDYQLALDSYEEAKSIMELNLGPNHLDVATVYSNIGDVYMATSRRHDALVCLKRALEIRWMHLDEHCPKIRRLLEKIAMMEMNTNLSADYFTQDDLDDKLLMEVDEEEHGGVQQELHLLQNQVEVDIQQVDDLRRKMALDMVKDKLHILKGMRQIELQHDDNNAVSASSAPSPDSSVFVRSGSSSKTPPPLSPMERQDALSSVKQRLAKLREQKALKSVMEESSVPADSDSHDNNENDDAKMEQQLGIKHLLELPKLNLESVLDD